MISWKGNVLFTLNCTAYSSVLLLCVVWFNVNKTLEKHIPTFYKIRFILEELYVAVMWIISQLITYIDQMNAAHAKISFNLKKNIYLSSRFRNIQHCTNIFHHHYMCHVHCIPYSCCTELIMCEVIRKLLEYINSWKMLFRFMSA